MATTIEFLGNYKSPELDVVAGTVKEVEDSIADQLIERLIAKPAAPFQSGNGRSIRKKNTLDKPTA